MHTSLLRILVTLALAACGQAALAQTCTLSTTTPLASAASYDPFLAGFNDSSGIFSITCTRTKADPRFSTTYYAYETFTGASPTLKNGSYTLDYALYQNYSGCSTPWGATAGQVYSFPNTLTKNSDVSITVTSGTSYCFRITGGANTAAPGTYTDIVQMGVADAGGTSVGTTSVTLQTTIAPSCKILVAPLPINLTYTSFQAGPSTNTGSFQMRCTNTTPYSLAIDAPVVGTNDKVLGLNYSVTTNAAGGIGNGLSQSYDVIVTIPPGQSGTCAGPGGSVCTGTVTRNVLIIY